MRIKRLDTVLNIVNLGEDVKTRVLRSTLSSEPNKLKSGSRSRRSVFRPNCRDAGN